MSYAIIAPEMMMTAAVDLRTIRADLSTAHATAATQTVALVPAAGDEVSAGIANLFSQHAKDYHVMAEKAAAFHDEFVIRLDAANGEYVAAEAANAAPFQVGPGSVIDQPPIDVPPPTPSSPVEIPRSILLFEASLEFIVNLSSRLAAAANQQALMMMAIYLSYLKALANIMKAMPEGLGAVVQYLR